jgi:glyoxylase-like metal-dependent hydrolase (beta-lactamase superfamily II)
MAHTLTRVDYLSLKEEYQMPITSVVYTHSHGDHVLGGQAIESAKFYSSVPTDQRCRENLNSTWKRDVIINQYSPVKDERPHVWESLQDLSVKLPDVTFDDEMRIGSKKEILLKHVGGHTSGSSFVIDTTRNVIFVGDLIFNGQFPYAGDPSCNPEDWIDALQEVANSKHDYIVPGHGKICTQADVEHYIAMLQEFRTNIKTAVNDDLTPEEFINGDMYPKGWTEGIDRWGEVSVRHWFEFYER